jgi:hypothetical protein
MHPAASAPESVTALKLPRQESEMKYSRTTYAALVFALAAANPTFAGTWNPVSSDGMHNTAVGTGALSDPDLDADGACHNTAVGDGALTSDASGSYNVASGFDSLFSNSAGDYNTGFGAYTLYSNTTGTNNIASGFNALYFNTSGSYNTATGVEALKSNTVGSNNTASGYFALHGNLSGANNIALGSYAGSATVGSNNIDIGNAGVATDNGVIRIGDSAKHNTTFIAAVVTKHITGSAVYVDSRGALGVLASSERYKTAITSMGDNTSKLQQLRPVTFHLKTEPKGALQYGLIAEEVDQVYPELVIRDAAGEIQGVRYDELAPILLNEVQQLRREQKTVAAQAEQIDNLQRQLAELQRMNQSIQATILELQGKDRLVGMR